MADTACVTIELIPTPNVLTNDALIAVDDNTQTEQNVPVIIAVKANDSDLEGLPLGTLTEP